MHQLLTQRVMYEDQNAGFFNYAFHLQTKRPKYASIYTILGNYMYVCTGRD